MYTDIVGNTFNRLGVHPLYKVWNSMRLRCYSEKNKDYKHYGARDIKICDEWLNNSEKFINWALTNGYKKGLEIDRINNDSIYSPENCRFATKSENRKNRRTYGKTGVKYVHKTRNWFQVQKHIDGKLKHFGIFKTLEEARKVAQKL